MQGGILAVRRHVIIGKKYGHLTVLAREGSNKWHQALYRCLCDCGNHSLVQKAFLFEHNHIRCKQCAPAAQGQAQRIPLVGKKIKGWHVIKEVDHKEGVYYYECECLNCGTISLKTGAQIFASKSPRCKSCIPDYHFNIEGDTAYGVLDDGTPFTIDAEDVRRFNLRFWRLNHLGYIHAANKNGPSIPLHRYLMGAHKKDAIIDHINRDRTDNRKSNLRIVTSTQNSYNHKRSSTNKTGYIGVCFSQNSQRYEAKIGYRNKRVFLGSSRNDPVLLAQRYNIAAQYLFGEYVGELNDVPLPPDQLIAQVQQKCQKLKEHE